ncbi:MAG TPA: methyl-accepting chemotaxis protein [Xanthobacteraceae bacterium]|nr:methyl-accepting chemotaxis protein [Xanthobacteraceae bacterium]
MFPRFFEAQVAQRLAVWGAMLGILVALYVSVELIHASRTSGVGREIARLSETMAAHASADAAFGRLAVVVPGNVDPNVIAADAAIVLDSIRREAALINDPGAAQVVIESGLLLDRIGKSGEIDLLAVQSLGSKRAVLGTALAGSIDDLRARHTDLLVSDRKNKILLALLALFVIGQIIFLEYRWLVKPMVRMAAILRKGEPQARSLDSEAFRRDEIGDLARALTQHFGMVYREKVAARDERAVLSDRLARQDEIKRETISFQNQIASVVQLLEQHAGRMSSASENLVAIASDADSRAAASAGTTQRVSGNVDAVASSIGDISKALTTVAEDAEKTSKVTAAARQLVEAASDDARTLTEAARTIEQVIALIHEVANQTNLLALNATIEAARAGEMGRGFAVVAAEVKQLATRTSKATEEIRGGLQGITSASVRIAERVDSLVESIEEVDEVAASIASSMRKQDANSRAITSNTSTTASDLRHFAETFHRVAGLVGDAKEAAKLVTAVSSDLSREAADLRTAVERYVAATQRVAA